MDYCLITTVAVLIWSLKCTTVVAVVVGDSFQYPNQEDTNVIYSQNYNQFNNNDVPAYYSVGVNANNGGGEYQGYGDSVIHQSEFSGNDQFKPFYDNTNPQIVNYANNVNTFGNGISQQILAQLQSAVRSSYDVSENSNKIHNGNYHIPPNFVKFEPQSQDQNPYKPEKSPPGRSSKFPGKIESPDTQHQTGSAQTSASETDFSNNAYEHQTSSQQQPEVVPTNSQIFSTSVPEVHTASGIIPVQSTIRAVVRNPVLTQHYQPQVYHAKVQGIPLSKHFHIARHVPIPIYKQIHVPVEKPDKVQIPHPVIFSLPQNYPFRVPFQQTVAVPVVKEVKVPTAKVIPYSMEKKLPYTIEKHVPYKVGKQVTKFQVPQPYPVKVPVHTVVHTVKGYGYPYGHRLSYH